MQFDNSMFDLVVITNQLSKQIRYFDKILTVSTHCFDFLCEFCILAEGFHKCLSACDVVQALGLAVCNVIHKLLVPLLRVNKCHCSLEQSNASCLLSKQSRVLMGY